MKKTKKMPKEVTLFRGVKMHPGEIENYEVHQLINLVGYTSTSRVFSKALKFAFCGAQPDQVPVIFEILFRGLSGLFELEDEYTAYPGENEVLLQDGL